MAGHSKWSNMKYRKERADQKKGKVFSRIMKEIISAVKQGGPDAKSNAKLRVAIQKAKEANMPNDNIERNIKRAASADQQDFSEMTYELYGYGGVGILVDIMTDNKNRISSDIRIATNKHGGTIATPGSVAYKFDRKGMFRVLKSAMDEDELFLLVSEAGAEDFSEADDSFIILSPVEQFVKVKEILTSNHIHCEEEGLAMIPKTLIEVSEEDANHNISLIEYLESLSDVDAVYYDMQV